MSHPGKRGGGGLLWLRRGAGWAGSGTAGQRGGSLLRDKRTCSRNSMYSIESLLFCPKLCICSLKPDYLVSLVPSRWALSPTTCYHLGTSGCGSICSPTSAPLEGSSPHPPSPTHSSQQAQSTTAGPCSILHLLNTCPGARSSREHASTCHSWVFIPWLCSACSPLLAAISWLWAFTQPGPSCLESPFSFVWIENCDSAFQGQFKS